MLCELCASFIDYFHHGTTMWLCASLVDYVGHATMSMICELCGLCELSSSCMRYVKCVCHIWTLWTMVDFDVICYLSCMNYDVICYLFDVWMISAIVYSEVRKIGKNSIYTGLARQPKRVLFEWLSRQSQWCDKAIAPARPAQQGVAS